MASSGGFAIYHHLFDGFFTTLFPTAGRSQIRYCIPNTQPYYSPFLYPAMNMRPYYLILLLTLASSLSAQPSYSPVAEQVLAARSAKQSFIDISPLSKPKTSHLPDTATAMLEEALADYDVLEYSAPDFSTMDAPNTIRLTLPTRRGKVVAELIRAEVLTDDFSLITSESNGQPVEHDSAVHYRGILVDDPTAIVAVSFLGEEMMGLVSRGPSSLVIGRMEGDKSSRHLLYEESNLKADFTPDCGTESHSLDEESQLLLDRLAGGESIAMEKTSACLRVYLELEYDLVTEKGGANGALNFISGLWNMVATLYQVENIATQISQVFTWTTPDTYPTGPTTGTTLSAFRQSRLNFNGDLAHLISRGAPTAGGVAYLDGLCNGSGYAYSYINSSYATVPTYSWSVNVLAHEMGHNLGSPHTHDCVWNGNGTPIDGCGPAAGYSSGCNGPLPGNGGTIMSYCHLVPSTGINFNNGFGQQPGDLIRAKISGASCLSNCSNNGCPLLTFSVDMVDCSGENDGAATVNPQGGTPPYVYAWSTGATTASISGLTAGIYEVTVTDAANCVEQGTVNIVAPSPLFVYDRTLDASPHNLGSSKLTISGGVAPYSISWSNGGTGEYVNNLAAGNYGYTLTDANGCNYSDTVEVLNRFTNCTDNILRITIQADDFPRDNGFALATDQLVYLDEISPVSEFIPAAGQLSRTYCLPDGCYAFGILDGQANGMCNGNSTSQGYYLIEDLSTGDTIAYECDFLNWSRVDFCLGTDSLSLNPMATDVSCKGDTDGTASVGVTGGTGAYAYSWSTGDTLASINGLSPGTYSVVVTSGWYTATASVVVGEPAILASSISGVDAVNGQNGSASVVAAGGVAPYQYSWSNGGITANINGLIPGNYGLTVTDANGCTAIDSILINDITSAVTISVTTTNVSCKGAGDGSASVSASGGTGSYAYLWSNGATTSSISGLLPGNYGVTVTSGNQSATASVTITQPSQMYVTVGTTSTVYGTSNGTANTTVSGGTPPYTYSWSTGDTTTSLNGLPAGNYSLTVTDANGCERVTTFRVAELIPPVVISLTATDASCAGQADGSVAVSASGGTGTFTYSWSNGATTPSVMGLNAGTYGVTVTSSSQSTSGSVVVAEPNPMAISVVVTDSAPMSSTGSAMTIVSGGTTPYTYTWSTGGTNNNISGQPAGSYTVTVTDANGCTQSESIVIGEIVAGLELLVTETPVSCFGGNDGTATAQASGGNGNYAYSWSNGGTTATISGLSAGTYFVTVTSGTQSNNGVTIINEPSGLSLTTSSNDEVNGNDGDAIATASGGTPPYTYLWSNGDNGATTGSLPAGTYTVAVTDANQCMAYDTVVIAPVSPRLPFERGQLSGVTDAWQTINLENTYTRPVVVATVIIPGDTYDPVVARVSNTTANTFDLRVQRPSGATSDNYTVEYVVVEEGVYDQATYGIQLEAVRATSSRTAARGRWNSNYLETRTYQQAYQNPVVLGQVMTENDTDWSVFWASAAGSRNNEPNASGFAAGKHVAEDGDRTRSNETIGYLVVEAGSGTVGGLDYHAGVGSDIVKGQENNANGYQYAFPNVDLAGGVLSSAGMDGSDGGWPVFKSLPNGSNGIWLATEEDQIRDLERRHTTEAMAYLVFGFPAGQLPVAKAIAGDSEVGEKASPVFLSANDPLLYPNPSRGVLHVEWSTDPGASVQLTVMDLGGRRYLSELHSASDDGSVRTQLLLGDLPRGLYLLRIETKHEQRSLRFVLVD